MHNYAETCIYMHACMHQSIHKVSRRKWETININMGVYSLCFFPYIDYTHPYTFTSMYLYIVIYTRVCLCICDCMCFMYNGYARLFYGVLWNVPFCWTPCILHTHTHTHAITHKHMGVCVCVCQSVYDSVSIYIVFSSLILRRFIHLKTYTMYRFPESITWHIAKYKFYS